MREAIRQYVEREEARESFKAEAHASWAAYQDTGRHLTGDETADWLNSWGTAAEIGRPACHD
jgi:predicted transcriptional regulator